MRKLSRNMVMCLLAIVLSVSSIGGVYTPVTQAEAATVTRYFIYLDNEEFEVTASQYEMIRQCQNSSILLQYYLSSILGDKIPDNYSTVTGKVVTSSDNGTSTPLPAATPTPTKGNENNDFLISNGVLISYRGSSAVVNVPSTVTSIGSFAFSGDNYVKAVILPDSVTSVSNYAFYNCTALRYVVFTKKATNLGTKLIYNCDSLTNIVAPSGSKAATYGTNSGIAVTPTQTTKFLSGHIYILKGDSQKQKLLNNIYGVTWKSSKPKTVSVSSSGKIKGRKTGSATITATANGKKYKYKVTIYNRTLDKRVSQIVKMTTTKKMSNYQKIKAVHNWLIANVKYDYTHYLSGNVPAVSHTAKGALMKKVAVCDGYSQAFILIMKKLGIKSQMVVGSSGGVGHGWNIVKLGGKWYHVDVTYDDPIVNGSDANTTPHYTYFLKSTSVMKKDHSFNASKYPKCTSKKYN